MEAVVDEPLGHVVDAHTGVTGDATQIKDALVGDVAATTGVQDGVVVTESPGHVVGGVQRVGRRRGESLSTHHRHVHPRDGEDPRRPPWRA